MQLVREAIWEVLPVHSSHLLLVLFCIYAFRKVLLHYIAMILCVFEQFNEYELLKCKKVYVTREKSDGLN